MKRILLVAALLAIPSVVLAQYMSGGQSSGGGGVFPMVQPQGTPSPPAVGFLNLVGGGNITLVGGGKIQCVGTC